MQLDPSKSVLYPQGPQETKPQIKVHVHISIL